MVPRIIRYARYVPFLPPFIGLGAKLGYEQFGKQKK